MNFSSKIILWLLKLGITMLIHNKDDIEFVTEFPCFLGHPVAHVVFTTLECFSLNQKYEFSFEPILSILIESLKSKSTKCSDPKKETREFCSPILF